ncbi:hypothetical protein KP509_38G039000 [Ceratopteris richardii]|uniref:Uncharacterized protein n=1 Tax=Ceratopteris richardii TaxID=49495 RepID=A0A8T2Q3Z3_CERRI|nr:hypothetical protein KP509_38G039000 [Ceratopteris richardii]
MNLVTVRQRYSPCQVEVESQEVWQSCMETSFDHLTALRALFTPSSCCEEPWRHKLESFLWIASAAFIIYYGDFRTNFLFLLATDSRIHRLSFNSGMICFMLNALIMLYCAYRLHKCDKVQDKLTIVGQGTISVATILGVMTFTLFAHAFWPIWRFLTIPMLVTLFMAIVVIAPYCAPFKNIKFDVDSSRGV